MNRKLKTIMSGILASVSMLMSFGIPVSAECVEHDMQTWAWGYYDSTQHRMIHECRNCDYYFYVYGDHVPSNTSGRYEKYNAVQHAVVTPCEYCGYGMARRLADHWFRTDSWTKDSDTQHKRVKKCTQCGYSETEYADHNFVYGSDKGYNDTQHYMEVSCSDCGYSGYIYENHSFSDSNWENTSQTEHSRTRTCSCGYSEKEYGEHNFIKGEISGYNDTQHYSPLNCSECDAEELSYEDHIITYGNWEDYSAADHRRTKSCICGYTDYDNEPHRNENNDSYCDVCGRLMTRFSVTVPSSLAIVMSEKGKITASTNAQIRNSSTGTVKVTTVNITSDNGWKIVPYTTNMAKEKVDSRKIGFTVNGVSTQETGTNETITVNSPWKIAAGESLPVTYNAVVSATSSPVSEKVLTLCFVIDWDR